MPPCPRKLTGQLRPAPMPRPVLSSLCLSATQLAQPVACHCQHVCTPDTCADSADCLQDSAGPEFCPHGLAPEEDKECTGSCRDPPPPCPVCAQHLLAQASPSVELTQPTKPQQPQPQYKEAAHNNTSSMELQQARQPTTGVNDSCCSGSCPTSRKTSFTNTQQNPTDSTQQPCCPVNVGPQQEKPVPQPVGKCNTNDEAKPDDSKGSCCKTGKGIQSGPHMRSDAASKSGKGRRPSLVQIQNGHQRRVSIKDQPGNETMEEEAPAAGPECQRAGGGLFPAATARCVCRMPPAFKGVCTGNLSGSCNCNDCNKQ